MRFRLAILLLMPIVISGLWLNAQTAPAVSQPQAPELKHVPAAYTNPASGREMYTAYCASCHGADGKGDGPAAPALKMAATNLTTLAQKNNGVFPAAHVATEIQGGAMTVAHGSKDMPVWGPVFMSLGTHSAAQTQLRIRNLTNYLESIQVK